MIRIVLVIFATGIFTAAVSAQQNMTIEEVYDLAQSVLNSTELWQEQLKHQSVEGRKSKFLPFGGAGFLPLQALWGFGGLNALAILFAIKFKIIIVFAIAAFAVFYYTKFLAIKKCHGNEYYREGSIYPMESSYSGPSYVSSPVTSYSSHYGGDISSAPFEPYGGYHDSVVHSDIPSYSLDHHDHHEHHDFDHHDFDHHSHDFDQFSHDHSISNVAPPSFGSDALQPGDGKDQPIDANPGMSATYRRVGKHRRRRQVDFIDFGELAFRFLGVDTNGCRKRFVCELDFRARTNPITRLAFSFIGRNFFERYRDLDEGAAKPLKFSDCAKMFNDCKDAEKYNDGDEDDEHVEVNKEESVKAEEEYKQAEDKKEESHVNNEKPANSEDLDDKEGGGDAAVEHPKESDDNNVRRKRHFNVHNFQIKRQVTRV